MSEANTTAEMLCAIASCSTHSTSFSWSSSLCKVVPRACAEIVLGVRQMGREGSKLQLPLTTRECSTTIVRVLTHQQSSSERHCENYPKVCTRIVLWPASRLGSVGNSTGLYLELCTHYTLSPSQGWCDREHIPNASVDIRPDLDGSK